MLDKLKNTIKDAIENGANRMVFDPTRFDDPLATQIRWTPIKGGGSNFRTHKYYNQGANQAGFKATVGAKVFSGIFLVAGLGISIGVPYRIFLSGDPLFAIETLVIILFGLVFFGAGLFMFRSYSKPVVFDKMVGYYWKGWKKPERYKSNHSIEGSIKISDIHALQIVSEYIRGDKKNYYSYELNIVTRDGERHNVIDHGDRTDMIADANKLSDFLGIPVWDAS
jgi:hypothetical protein